MSVKTTTDETAVYGSGHLIGYPHLKDKPGPESQSGHGVVYCEAGIARLTVDVYARRDGHVFQSLTAVTVIDGRMHVLHQTRTGRDMVTHAGAKRIALRWLRGAR